MSIEIQWTDTDPETGKKRIVCAEKFAGKWAFKSKQHRRGEWTPGFEPTRDIWEYLLECLENRYWRREGVSEEDIEQVQRLLKDLPIPRNLDAE